MRKQFLSVRLIDLGDLTKNVFQLFRYKKGRTGSAHGLSGLKLLAVTLKQLLNPYQILILPITMFIGAEQAFMAADFNAVSFRFETTFLSFAVLLNWFFFPVLRFLRLGYQQYRFRDDLFRSEQRHCGRFSWWNRQKNRKIANDCFRICITYGAFNYPFNMEASSEQ